MQSSETPSGAIDSLLASYAAGSLTKPLQVLVASHLELRAENRAFVALLEAAAGVAVADREGTPLSRHEAILSNILSLGEAEVRALEPDVADPVLPRALRAYAGHGLADLPWRFKLPGIREVRVAETEAGEAVLYWVKAGRRLPRHTHEGEEYTLLLRGGFTDPLGHYRRGDIAIADAELDHDPVADIDEDCLCFAVTDAPLRLTGPIPTLLRRVFGR